MLYYVVSWYECCREPLRGYPSMLETLACRFRYTDCSVKEDATRRIWTVWRKPGSGDAAQWKIYINARSIHIILNKEVETKALRKYR